MREDGYSLLLTHSEGDPRFDAENLRLLGQRRVDGLLLSLQSESQTPIVTELMRMDLPIVLIDREVQGVVASVVRCDHRSGVRAATQHLLSLGHSRIGFLSGPSDILSTRDRLAGFHEALVRGGLSAREELIRLGSYTRQFGYEQTIQMLSLPERPTAILSAGIQSTTGVLAAAAQFGLAIPDDLSLVACDDIELLQYLSPPISVVRRDALLIGRLAAGLLLERLSAEESVRDAVVPTEYVPRRSVSPPQSDG